MIKALKKEFFIEIGDFKTLFSSRGKILINQ
jgi:hypothetical protein